MYTMNHEQFSCLHGTKAFRLAVAVVIIQRGYMYPLRISFEHHSTETSNCFYAPVNRLSTTMDCNVTRGFCKSIFVLELWLAHLISSLGFSDNENAHSRLPWYFYIRFVL